MAGACVAGEPCMMVACMAGGVTQWLGMCVKTGGNAWRGACSAFGQTAH